MFGGAPANHICVRLRRKQVFCYELAMGDDLLVALKSLLALWNAPLNEKLLFNWGQSACPVKFEDHLTGAAKDTLRQRNQNRRLQPQIIDILKR